ncbi:MAG: class I SAM-dependent methyltransferase [Reyranella sp.]
MCSTRSHWEDVYTSKADTAVSWYQPHPERSLELIALAAPGREAAIIDIGGGASTLSDDMLAAGYTDFTVLDVAEAALVKSRDRLGSGAARICWIVADITQWTPPRVYDVWHDRAVFHFLTESAQQDAYMTALKAGSRPGSVIIIATFALDGPEKCSGLAVQRYSSATLSKRLGPSFSLTAEALETHKTPWGAEQRFQYSTFRRTAN